MKEKPYSMWIEAENWVDGEWDIYDDNTDVIADLLINQIL